MNLTINKVDFGVALTTPQLLKVAYRLASLPDINGSYINLPDLSVPVSGNVTYVVNNLPDDELVIRLTNLCNNSVVKKNINVANCNLVILRLSSEVIGTCPVGYVPLDTDVTKCFKELQENPTQGPGTTKNMIRPTGDNSYSQEGVLVYKLDKVDPRSGRFLKTASAPNSEIFTKNTNSFWRNITGTSGPLRRTMVWSPDVADSQVGFSFCLNVPTDKVYYIGVGADNAVTIKINGGLSTDEINTYTTATNLTPNGTVINGALPNNPSLAFPTTSDNRWELVQDETTISIAVSGLGQGETFKNWHVYPVFLKKGLSFLEIFGRNAGGTAAVGVEIYDATESDLLNATNYADLGCTITGGTHPETNPIASGGTLNYTIPGSKVLFSTYNSVGSRIQLGTSGLNCTTGFYLDACTNPLQPICKKLDLVQKTENPKLTYSFVTDTTYDGTYSVLIYRSTDLNTIVRSFDYTQPLPTVIINTIDLPKGTYVVTVRANKCNGKIVANGTINII